VASPSRPRLGAGSGPSAILRICQAHSWPRLDSRAGTRSASGHALCLGAECSRLLLSVLVASPQCPRLGAGSALGLALYFVHVRRSRGPRWRCSRPGRRPGLCPAVAVRRRAVTWLVWVAPCPAVASPARRASTAWICRCRSATCRCVLPHDNACCRATPRTAACCRVLPRAAACCRVLPHAVTCCCTSRRAATHCCRLWRAAGAAVCYRALPCATAPLCATACYRYHMPLRKLRTATFYTCCRMLVWYGRGGRRVSLAPRPTACPISSTVARRGGGRWTARFAVRRERAAKCCCDVVVWLWWSSGIPCPPRPEACPVSSTVARRGGGRWAARLAVRRERAARCCGVVAHCCCGSVVLVVVGYPMPSLAPKPAPSAALLLAVGADGGPRGSLSAMNQRAARCCWVVVRHPMPLAPRHAPFVAGSLAVGPGGHAARRIPWTRGDVLLGGRSLPPPPPCPGTAYGRCSVVGRAACQA